MQAEIPISDTHALTLDWEEFEDWSDEDEELWVEESPDPLPHTYKAEGRTPTTLVMLSVYPADELDPRDHWIAWTRIGHSNGFSGAYKLSSRMSHGATPEECRALCERDAADLIQEGSP